MTEERALGTTLVTGALLLGILVVGVSMRMVEPMSSPALGAEDPFTHVVFTKEALERGWFGDSVYLGTPMYPPGLHAASGIFAPLAGIRLYDLARFAPVVFGALAVLGTFVLARRLGGPVAGLVAALFTAVLPEHVFRTNVFFPTGLDLALLPAFLLLFHEAVVAHGSVHKGAAAGFLVVGAMLTFAHPWVVPLFAAPALAYAALRYLRAPGPAQPLFAAAGLATLVSAFAMATRWRASDTGFAEFFAALPGLKLLSALDLPGPVLFAALVAVIGVASVGACWLVMVLALIRLPRAVRIGLAVVAAAALFLATRRLATGVLPSGVSYVDQLGYVAMTMAMIGLVVACVAPTAAGDLALPMGALLFPLTAINVFHSIFWPQRTVAYLCIPVALLASLPLAWVAERGLARVRNVRIHRVVAPVAVACALLLVAGAVAARPAPVYTWYRLYTPAEFAGFERTGAALSLSPTSQAVVYDWQPALLVKTLASPAQARYSQEYFRDGSVRDKIAGEAHEHLYVVVDSYTMKAVAKGKADVSFLDQGGYRLVYQTAGGSFKLYEVAR